LPAEGYRKVERANLQPKERKKRVFEPQNLLAVLFSNKRNEDPGLKMSLVNFSGT